MAVRGLEETTSRLDQAKQLGGVVLIAAILSAIVVGVLILSGLFGFVPAPRVVVFGVVVPPTWTAYFGAFTLALVLTISYVYFSRLILSTARKVKKFWLGLSPFVQAVVLGVQAGLIAGLSFYLTDLYFYGFQTTTILAVAAGAAVVTTYATIQVRQLGWTLSEWARAMYLSVLVAGVVAALTTFAFAGVAPGYTPPVVFLVGWGVCTYLLFRRRGTIEDSAITRLLTRTGYAQMRQVETLSVSVGTGMALALVVAALVGIAGAHPSSTLQRTGLSLLLVWPMVTIATSIGWPTHEHTDLVIEDIQVRQSTTLRELTVRNIGNRPVNLADAKITDANNVVYHIGINVSLGAGEAGRFEIPEGFELATHEPYEVLSLPFGFIVKKEATEPGIVTRRGERYTLMWIDQHPSQQPPEPDA